ncbi:serine recombinase [Clostridia bacterium]|nr:serine recombinase [Clostridia bacterium]
MIADALDGKLDMIITKSVSRFARNTVDSLSTIRKLKDAGVECYFEKENILTFDPKCEVMLSILASLAQEESRSISENVRWGWKKRMSDGKVCMPYKRFLGYEKGEGGQPRVVENEAEIVRRIYRLFITGWTPGKIARTLTEEGIPTPCRKTIWSGRVIESILTNEKYCGNALLQKVIKPDILSKRPVKNTGQADQFFVQNSHPGIVSVETYDIVQEEFARRKQDSRISSNSHIFTNKIVCGKCGHFYREKLWHSTDRYKKAVWRCGAKYERQTKCKTPHVDEATIKRLFTQAVNWVLGYKDEIVDACEEIKETLLDTSDLEAESAIVRADREDAYSVRRRLIEDHKHSPQADFTARDAQLEERMNSSKQREDEILAGRQARISKAKQVDLYCRRLLAVGCTIDHFDESLWMSLLDRVTVYTKDDIRFTFRDGMTIGGKEYNARRAQ